MQHAASSYAPYTAYKGFAGRQPAMMVHEMSSPGVALYRHAMAGGLGNDVEIAPPPPGPEIAPPLPEFSGGLGVSLGVLAGLALIGVAINYQIGKAMAPDMQSERKWAWGNAIGGTIFPPTTIGMAIYKNYIR